MDLLQCAQDVPVYTVDNDSGIVRRGLYLERYYENNVKTKTGLSTDVVDTAYVIHLSIYILHYYTSLTIQHHYRCRRRRCRRLVMNL